jgi:hypothetical protein
MTSKNTLTLHKGGTGEKEIPIKSLTVPDLWHVAQYHHDKSLAPAVEPWHALQHKMIMEAWSLAHAMKDRLQANQVDQVDFPTVLYILAGIINSHECPNNSNLDVLAGWNSCRAELVRKMSGILGADFEKQIKPQMK